MTSANEISCDQCRELLSDYIDRELSAEEKASVEKHLGDCVKCGSESTRMMGMKKIVQHWDGVKGSGEFRKSVMEKMIRESQQVPAAQFNDAVALSEQSAPAGIISAPGEMKESGLHAFVVLAVFAVIAVCAYFVVTWLRGV